MKKPTLIFILLLFAACAVVGYFIASGSNLGSSNVKTDKSNVSTALASPQQNFLLVRVNDLTSSKPKLVEVWIVLTLYSDPPQIMFVPLYPKYEVELNSAIASSFVMDTGGYLSEKLISKISDQFGVKVDGYILTDTVGMNAFANWFGIEGISATSNPAQTDEEKHTVLLNSQFFLQNVCRQIKNGKALDQYSSIRWSQLIPLHFQTDLSFSHLIASWDKVNHASTPQQCDVLSSE